LPVDQQLFKVKPMGVGRFIRELRQAKGWTYQKLSDLSGVDPGTIHALEQRDSTRSTYFAPLAEALGMPLQMLLQVAKEGELPVRWTNGNEIWAFADGPDGRRQLHLVPSDDDFDAPVFSRAPAQKIERGALRPILAWQHETDLPEGEFVMVPRLDVKLSAGPGSGANQLELAFDDSQLRAYSADWIRKHRLKPNKLRIMKGSGRSMEPTVFDGDDLLINLAETEIIDAKVYALWYEGGERVKRLYRMPGGGLRIRSDNDKEFPEIVLGADYAGHVRVIGRVIDRSGPGGL
jgi:phage repressor protein C with HTH and peptisase S24 domain